MKTHAILLSTENPEQIKRGQWHNALLKSCKFGGAVPTELCYFILAGFVHWKQKRATLSYLQDLSYS